MNTDEHGLRALIEMFSIVGNVIRRAARSGVSAARAERRALPALGGMPIAFRIHSSVSICG